MSLFRSRAVNFDEKWEGLRETIGRVVRLQTVEMTKWNDHYSDIYALCEAFPTPYAERLYSETEDYLSSLVTDICQHLTTLEPHSMLSSYQKHWLSYRQGAKFLHNLFAYFNRVSLRKYKPVEVENPLEVILCSQNATPPAGSPLEIRNMCLCVWKNGVLEKLCSALVKAVLKEICRDRDGETGDLGMVRDVISSLIEVEEYSKQSSLCYYQRMFEAPFLAETKEYYLHVASKLVSELEVSEYMCEVVQRLQAAKRRGQRFLHQTSMTKFIRECEARLVEDYKTTYLYSKVHTMVHEERRQDLKNLFYLLNGIPGALDVLLTEFEQRIRSQGLAALSPLNTDKPGNVVEFMSAVIGIHSHYHQLVTDLFSSHKQFYSTLDRACRVFVNAQEKNRQHPRAPMLLARYCDQLLRKTSKGTGEQEIEDRLEEVITVFRYIDDKDVFQRFYSRMLSRRLMQNLSISMEMEEGMIQRLKHACGFEYVARLQRMVVDMKLSEDGMAAFQEHLSLSSTRLPLTFYTLVLQSAAWPFSKPTGSFNVPPQLLVVIGKFEMFYEAKYTGRKLSWLYQMSIGDLRLTYLKRPYTVSVTTYQIAILLAFNTKEQHSYSSLQHHTGLDHQELTITLQSLIDSKLLLLENGETTVHPAHECMVRLNKNYSNKRTKFKITASLQRDTQQEVEQTQKCVQEDRKLHIQAAIVRLMKARKSLKHNLLIEETIQLVRSRFTPSVAMIKRSIGTLLERQYLERQETASDTYNYVA